MPQVKLTSPSSIAEKFSRGRVSLQYLLERSPSVDQFFNCELEGVLGSPESCPSVKTSQEWLATRFILLVVCCKNSDSEPAKRTASEVSIRQITLL